MNLIRYLLLLRYATTLRTSWKLLLLLWPSWIMLLHHVRIRVKRLLSFRIKAAIHLRVTTRVLVFMMKLHFIGITSISARNKSISLELRCAFMSLSLNSIKIHLEVQVLLQKWLFTTLNNCLSTAYLVLSQCLRLL